MCSSSGFALGVADSFYAFAFDGPSSTLFAHHNPFFDDTPAFLFDYLDDSKPHTYYTYDSFKGASLFLSSSPFFSPSQASRRATSPSSGTPSAASSSAS